MIARLILLTSMAVLVPSLAWGQSGGEGPMSPLNPAQPGQGAPYPLPAPAAPPQYPAYPAPTGPAPTLPPPSADPQTASPMPLSYPGASAVVAAPMVATQPYPADPYFAQPIAPSYPSPSYLAAPPLSAEVDGSLAAATSPHWVFSAEALWLERTDDRGVFLGSAVTTINSGSPGLEVDRLHSDDTLFALATGVKLQLGYRLGNQDALEFTYYGLQQWSTGRSIYGDPVNGAVLVFSPYTQTDTLIGGFDTRLGYSYKSRFNNVEITDRFVGTGGYSWSVAGLWGLRYIQLSDKFVLTGQDTLTGDFENIDIHTANNLLGPQIGLQIIRDWGRFQLNSELKAALFANFNSERYSNLNSSGASGNPPGFVTVNQNRQSTDLAGLIELSLIAKYQLTDHLWLRGGYQTTWVGGLAIGPRQLGHFNSSGSVGLDGPSLGFDVVW